MGPAWVPGHTDGPFSKLANQTRRILVVEVGENVHIVGRAGPTEGENRDATDEHVIHASCRQGPFDGPDDSVIRATPRRHRAVSSRTR